MPGTLNPIRTLIVNSLPEPEAEDSAASILHWLFSITPG